MTQRDRIDVFVAPTSKSGLYPLADESQVVYGFLHEPPTGTTPHETAGSIIDVAQGEDIDVMETRKIRTTLRRRGSPARDIAAQSQS